MFDGSEPGRRPKLYVPTLALLAVLVAACGDDDDDGSDPGALRFGSTGSISAPSGRGSFTFGVATAAQD